MGSKKYTDEVVAFIKKNSDRMTRKELADLLKETFGMDATPGGVQWICKELKIKGSPNFVKGVCPHKETKYKIGDECFLAGEWRIITSTEERVPILKRSEYKKRALWKETYGSIPNNHCFIYLDGNKRNCTIENLACVPILWMRIMNQNGWLHGNREVTLSAMEWCRLHYSLSVKSGNRYVKPDGKKWS